MKLFYYDVVTLVTLPEPGLLDAVALYLLATQPQSRCELSHQARSLRHRDFPDTEKAQHMVDAVGIEILLHFAEAAHPPLAAVTEHLVPVVGRESPVLPVSSKLIGWCSCLSVQVEVFRFCPDRHLYPA